MGCHSLRKLVPRVGYDRRDVKTVLRRDHETIYVTKGLTKHDRIRIGTSGLRLLLISSQFSMHFMLRNIFTLYNIIIFNVKFKIYRLQLLVNRY